MVIYWTPVYPELIYKNGNAVPGMMLQRETNVPEI